MNLQKIEKELPHLSKDELLQLFLKTETELKKRLELDRNNGIIEPILPKVLLDFIYDNRGYFEGSLELEDIDVGSVCLDLNSNRFMVYEATILEGDTVFEWEIKNNELVAWIDGKLVLESSAGTDLTYIDIAIL